MNAGSPKTLRRRAEAYSKVPLINPINADFIPVELDPILRVSKSRSVALQPGPSTWTHYHDSMELGRCYTGSGIATVNQRIFPFKPGDVFVVWPGQFHMAWTLEGTSNWNFLNFDAEDVSREASRSLRPLPNARTVEECRFAHILAAERNPSVSHLVETVFSELRGKNPGYEIASRNLLSTLLVWIRRELLAKSSPALNRHSNDLIVRLEPALTRMCKAYSEPLDIRRLAAMCHMSESTFRRSFSAAVGQSPLEYLLGLRVNTASALLATTDLSIKEIALRCGYPSPSDFSRCFRKLAKTSPNSYREAHWGKTQSQT